MGGTAQAAGWSLDDIRSFCADAAVLARSPTAGVVAPPSWLVPGDVAPDWGDQVSAAHPSDRSALVTAWWDAVAHPGMPVTCRFRSSIDGTRWHLIEARYLNLVDHEDVGAVLIAHVDLGRVDAPVPARTSDGTSAEYDAPVWIIQHLDPVGTVLRTDGLVDDVFGVSAETLAGRNVLDVLHPDDHDAAIAMWLEVVSEPNATRTIRQRVVRPDGTSSWLESTVMNQLAESGAVVAVSHDVSARRAQEAALRASEHELRTLAESVPVAVFRATADGELTYANALWYEVTAPYGPVTSLLELAVGTEGADLALVWSDLVRRAPGSLDTEVGTIDGRTLRLRCRSLPSAPGGAVVLGTLDDVSADVAMTEELRSRAERDDLTGLANRSGLERRVQRIVAADAGDHVLVFVDLDGFKAVNDTWGHLAGDAVLGQVAVRLRSAVRPADLVARYGGDEFVLLCSEVLAGEDETIVGRIEAALADPIEAGDAVWQPAASYGVVRPRPGEPLASTLRRADAEMYQRKRGDGVDSTR